MSIIIQPWQLFLLSLSGWINRHQQHAIEYLITENQVLKEKLGKKRILLNDDQRNRLAVKGKLLGRKLLSEIATTVTPDKILRWHRQLAAEKWNYSDRRTKKPGRPPVSEEARQLVLRMARENPTWGYDRIQGALSNLGYSISDRAVGNILSANGIEPAPEQKRQTTWKTFLKAHGEVLGAIDFTTFEVWTKGGLVTYYLLFVMEIATRRVYFAGCSVNPDEAWMMQIGRNLTDTFDGFLNGKRYVLMDRDGKFCLAFRAILKNEDIKPVQLPPRSPDLNGYIERFHRSLKEECLDRMIFFGEGSLRKAINTFMEHFHTERNHQGIANRLIEPGEEVGLHNADVLCRDRLGGMLRYYYRKAA
ncbi:MAG: DDE-type integrase/transposase/recombinase [Candidatus Latescibacteria bacterium]|nr:DDE-type integrase/transposase/recombinase [Candidatus Latescibacterota bacterium]NIO56211.1 DDE-type integrase/transposase/recombinase [Candidatus Latescibacterota bacterium]